MRVPRWLVGFVLLWICAITAVSGWGYQRQEHTNDELARQNEAIVAENLARLESSCESGDETRVLIRQVSKDGDLEVGESIIEVASADPEIVAQFRDVLGRRLTANVNQLPGREWDEESQTCVDVELDE